MKFTGKNVLVTGGSRGIGASICRKLASFKLKVWINYRSKEELAISLKKEIESLGGSADIIHFDVSCEDSFSNAIKHIVEKDGCLNYLVNNAGITNDKLALRMKKDDFTGVIEANLTSAFLGCRESLKVMGKQRFGSVVNIASIVGERGNIGQTNYAASKGGMIAMNKAFALEGALRNIRFNVITPGFIQTEMTDALSLEVRESYIKNIPLARFGTGDEVADAVAFLLSDMSLYITGDVLKVNGGFYM